MMEKSLVLQLPNGPKDPISKNRESQALARHDLERNKSFSPLAFILFLVLLMKSITRG